MGKNIEVASLAPAPACKTILVGPMFNSIIVKTLQGLFKLYYYLLSPWLGNRCRFVPSCSEYAQQALSRHGALKGLWLTLRRLARCHPWGGHGQDPVPDLESQNNSKN